MPKPIPPIFTWPNLIHVHEQVINFLMFLKGYTVSEMDSWKNVNSHTLVTWLVLSLCGQVIEGVRGSY